MNRPSVRVAVKCEDEKIPISFPSHLQKKDMILKALSLFKIPKSDIGRYQLLIQDLDCEAGNAQTLLKNETLMLSKREKSVDNADFESLSSKNLIKLFPLISSRSKRKRFTRY